MSDKTIKSMRRMAWHRAKAELQSVLECYWPEYRNDGTEIYEGFNEASELIGAFTEKMDEVLL